MQDRDSKEEAAPTPDGRRPAAGNRRHLRLIGEEWTPTTADATTGDATADDELPRDLR